MSENEKAGGPGLGGVPTPADFFGWLNQMMTMPAKAVSAAIPQSSTMSGDPLAMWRNLSQQNEEAWAKFMQQMVATPEFAQNLGRSANSAAGYKTMIKQAAKTYLDAAGLPGIDDITRLGEMLVTIDGRLDDLTDGLSDTIGGTAPLLERMVATLETMANRIQQLENQVQTLREQGPRPIAEKLETIEAKLTGREAINGLNQWLMTLENKMPTREDVSKLGQQVTSLENKAIGRDELGSLNEKLEALEAKISSRDEMSGIEGKLAALTGQLNRLETQLVAKAASDETEPVTSFAAPSNPTTITNRNRRPAKPKAEATEPLEKVDLGEEGKEL